MWDGPQGNRDIPRNTELRTPDSSMYDTNMRILPWTTIPGLRYSTECKHITPYSDPSDFKVGISPLCHCMSYMMFVKFCSGQTVLCHYAYNIRRTPAVWCLRSLGGGCPGLVMGNIGSSWWMQISGCVCWQVLYNSLYLCYQICEPTDIGRQVVIIRVQSEKYTDRQTAYLQCMGHQMVIVIYI